MKRVLFSIICLMLITAIGISASCEAPQISPNLFTAAKDGLICLASGEYERLVTVLPFSGSAPSADEWRSFAGGNFSTLTGGVQTEYAVAYWSQNAWKLAIPLQAPAQDSIEVFVLLSSDGYTFNGYRYAKWGDISRELQQADYATWNREYINTSLVISFD